MLDYFIGMMVGTIIGCGIAIVFSGALIIAGRRENQRLMARLPKE